MAPCSGGGLRRLLSILFGATLHGQKLRAILVPEELLRLVAVAEFQSRQDALRHDFQEQAGDDR